MAKVITLSLIVLILMVRPQGLFASQGPQLIFLK
jgi:branched-subunit amino acid ABC-type transport system permease component